MPIPWMEKYKGNKHSKWKGGRLKTVLGYILIYAPKHPFRNKVGKGYVLEHRLVMEKKLGRYLTKNEIVHHINGIKDDNRLKNLVLTTFSEHTKFHKTGQIVKESSKQKHRENIKKRNRNNNGRLLPIK